MKKSSKKKKIAIACAGAAVILAGLAVVLHGCGAEEEASEATVQEAQTMTIEKTISSEGEITSTLEENVEPHTSYYLKKINVEEGDAVSEGDTILTYTNGYTMEAPYDCVIESWYLPDTGDQLTSDHYVTIAGTDVLQIELSVGEDEVSLLEKGKSAQVTVEATGSTYTGEVSYVSEQGEYTSGMSTFSAKVVFDNDGKLKLGMTGTAEITLDKAENVIGVPASAVHITNGTSCVTVVNGDGTDLTDTEEVEVETGVSNDSYIEIKSGLAEGDLVLVPASDDSEEDSGSFGRPDGDGSGGMQMPGGSEGGGMQPPGQQ
ncbi:MAG: HlyD family efflux transporter periplasmic adaptor subunit [Clostridia bacterium]|nr:HlyD family efflux transporter periplasmic adaptor subunit [Clostridia bacterium]